jgi:hypothetical protein
MSFQKVVWLSGNETKLISWRRFRVHTILTDVSPSANIITVVLWSEPPAVMWKDWGSSLGQTEKEITIKLKFYKDNERPEPRSNPGNFGLA